MIRRISRHFIRSVLALCVFAGSPDLVEPWGDSPGSDEGRPNQPVIAFGRVVWSPDGSKLTTVTNAPHGFASLSSAESGAVEAYAPKLTIRFLYELDESSDRRSLVFSAGERRLYQNAAST